ncbi:MAG: Fe-S cluster assembly protein IscX [Bryobacterales bacterium]|nr:Fe-S cluster assembly protein IscX [Bryobacterales bacterium]
MKKLDWSDAQDIAYALYGKYPDVDPLEVRFTDLHKWVTGLEEFAGEPSASNEAILEAIQMAWYDEWEDEE